MINHGGARKRTPPWFMKLRGSLFRGFCERWADCLYQSGSCRVVPLLCQAAVEEGYDLTPGAGSVGTEGGGGGSVGDTVSHRPEGCVVAEAAVLLLRQIAVFPLHRWPREAFSM